MKCNSCGKEIDNGACFCGYCGKKQTNIKYCCNCGKELDRDADFCGYCGEKQIDGIQSTSENDALYVKNNIVDSSEQTETLARQNKVESVPENAPPITDETNSSEIENKKRWIKYVIITSIVIVCCIVVGSYINSSSNNSNYSNTQIEEYDTVSSMQNTETLEDSLNEENAIDEGFDFAHCITQVMLTDNGVYKFNFNMKMEECAKIANSKILDAHAEPCGYRYIDKFNGVEVQIDITGNVEDPLASVDDISISFDLSNQSSSEIENAFHTLYNYIKKNLDVNKCINKDKSSVRFETRNKAIEMNFYNNFISLSMETLYESE